MSEQRGVTSTKLLVGGALLLILAFVTRVVAQSQDADAVDLAAWLVGLVAVGALVAGLLVKLVSLGVREGHR